MESLPTLIPSRALARIHALHREMLAAQKAFNESLSIALEALGYDTQATVKPNINLETGTITLPSDLTSDKATPVP